MPYVVLARRWRPRLFKDVVGQEHVTKTLQNAISADRIAHAYLFSGPRGVGKTTVARILAKAVNCVEGPQPEPCEKCINCTEISSGRSIDVIEMDAASNRRIDEIREIRESVKFAPVSGRYKVYIIDEAHMIVHEAFNAFLKTLEEPPEHVIFILATTEPHKIPATILSRCQRFDFRTLTRSEIIDRLRKIADSDSLSIDDESLSLIAESADGAMRDAESILDQLVSFGGRKVQEEEDPDNTPMVGLAEIVSSDEGKVQEEKVPDNILMAEDVVISAEEVSSLLGLGEYRLLDQLAEDILQGNSAESLKTLNDLADRGADLSQCLKRLVAHFRDVMIYKENPDLIDASETKLQRLANQSQGVSTDRLMKIARILTQAESDTKQLGYERLNLELALIRLSRLEDDAVPLAEVLDKLEEIESKLRTGDFRSASVVAEPEPIYTEAEASVIEDHEEQIENNESDPLRATWSKLLGNLKEKGSPMLHALLKEASLVAIGDADLTINFDPRFNWHREQVQEVKNKRAIEAELLEIMGKPMGLRIKAKDSSQDGNSEESVPTSTIDMLRDAKEDESVKLVLDVFNGRIVEVKQ